MNLLKRAMLVFCFIGLPLFVTSCATNHTVSSNSEKGYGGEGSGAGGGGHGGMGGVGGGGR